MPRNKDFAHRLEVLDTCLRRYLRKWDAEALLDEMNVQLAEKWGKKISRRTLFADLKYLREEIQAPIEKYRSEGRVYYRYSEPDYSIRKLPLTAEDVGYLREAVQMLRQVSSFAMLDDVEGIISKLEHTASGSEDALVTTILFEQHSKADGAHYLDDLLEAIKGKLPLQINYQPFHASRPTDWTIHPYLLKEFRGRWFLISRMGDSSLTIVLALDRIRRLKPANVEFIPNNLFHPDTFYDNVIGVTLPEGESVQEIRIRVYGSQCSYIRTKPIHRSQQIVEEPGENDFMEISLQLINNYELRGTLLSYGPGIEVLSPEKLRLQMSDLYSEGIIRYS